MYDSTMHMNRKTKYQHKSCEECGVTMNGILKERHDPPARRECRECDPANQTIFTNRQENLADHG